jgi:hypothetical protein
MDCPESNRWLGRDSEGVVGCKRKFALRFAFVTNTQCISDISDPSQTMYSSVVCEAHVKAILSGG